MELREEDLGLRRPQAVKASKPRARVESVSGSGIGVTTTLPASATEKVSLPPASLVSRAARPMRLPALAASVAGLSPPQPATAPLVQMKASIALAWAASSVNAKPRLLCVWSELLNVFPPAGGTPDPLRLPLLNKTDPLALSTERLRFSTVNRVPPGSETLSTITRFSPLVTPT